VIITFEDRVFEAVLDQFNSKRSRTFEMTHVVNLEVNDTHAHAAIGAKYAVSKASRSPLIREPIPDLAPPPPCKICSLARIRNYHAQPQKPRGGI